MKNITHVCMRAIILGGLLTMAGLSNSPAQSTTQTTTTRSETTSAGTITEFNPDVITVRTQSSPAPVRYSYSRTTTYVDENGNPVSMDIVRSGVPVTVYYTQDGDRMIASKVVVRKIITSDGTEPVIEQKKTTTTTTTTPNND